MTWYDVMCALMWCEWCDMTFGRDVTWKTTIRKDQNERSWMPWAHRNITIRILKHDRLIWRESFREIITWSWLVETQRCESCYQEQKYKNKRYISLFSCYTSDLKSSIFTWKMIELGILWKQNLNQWFCRPKNGRF